jgi:hypothetical protein
MKMIKPLFLALLLVILAGFGALAANTETQEGNTIMLVLDGTTNWDSRINNPGGLNLFMVVFSPSAAGDNLVVRHNGPDGNIIFPGKSVSGEPLALQFPESLLFKPYIKASDCTLGTAASARVMLVIK